MPQFRAPIVFLPGRGRVENLADPLLDGDAASAGWVQAQIAQAIALPAFPPSDTPLVDDNEELLSDG